MTIAAINERLLRSIGVGVAIATSDELNFPIATIPLSNGLAMPMAARPCSA